MATKTKVKKSKTSKAPKKKAAAEAEAPAKKKATKKKVAKKEKAASKETAEKTPKKGGSHPSHPPCPECGRAMYKTMEKGKAVKKADPWAFCRNPNCDLFGVDQSAAGIVDGEKPDEDEGAVEKTVEETAVGKEPKKEKSAKKKKADKGGKEKKSKKKAVDKEKVKRLLLAGELSRNEIAEECGCSLKTVRLVKKQIEDDSME